MSYLGSFALLSILTYLAQRILHLPLRIHMVRSDLWDVPTVWPVLLFIGIPGPYSLLECLACLLES